ncbi:hypothetical protein [Granulicoccus sp. GXG6511]|uniref:hypothetical protein n=1 Tax=Granulicoccus sp. GXG6511 TaxID=3381351 RepID=UPI003D7D573D
MTASGLGVTLAIVNLLFLAALIGVGIWGLVRTSGRTRALIGGGVGVLVVGRIVGMMLPALFSAVGTGGQSSFFVLQMTLSVVTNLLTLLGMALLVGAAVAAVAHRSPNPYAGFHNPPPPGPQSHPAGPPSGGWR